MSRYNELRDIQDKRYVPKYPDIPLNFQDQYFITTEGDRFDILAQQFYNDSSLWWIISIANPQLPQNSLYITPGTQIRVPFNPADIIQRYRSLNSL
jgi:hypothetical protein